MTYQEAIKHDAYTSLPKLGKGDVTFLWYSDFWDGPKSGMALYQGRKYWFQLFQESQHPDLSDFYRRFLLIDLSDEQLSEEERWHALFQEKVGRHMDFGTNQRDEINRLKPPTVQEEFYSRYKQRKPMQIDDNTVVAWFES